MANCSGITDSDWVKDNAETARTMMREHSVELEELSRAIWDAPDKAPTLDELADWVKARALEGREIIVVDPVTAAEASAKPWVADLKFLMRVKSIARSHNTRVVLVTHPRKGQLTGKDLSDLAGGAAYERFSQCVLWVHRPDEPKAARCVGTMGAFTANINRTIQIRKARNGPGQGGEIGYIFDAKTLRLAEQGWIEEA